MAREMAASEEAAAASIRAAAREAPRSVALEYVPCEVPSTLPAGAVDPGSNVACLTGPAPPASACHFRVCILSSRDERQRR